jgi:uncharacterized repeat protein (TIGR04076 family)
MSEIKGTPEEQKLIEERKKFLKKSVNITDEDFEKYISFPAHRKLAFRRSELTKYQIIAEVVSSKYCNAGLKVGQKYVIGVIPSKLLIDQSTAPLCLKALGPVSEIVECFWDRMLEGLDPNEGMWQYVTCPDQGVEYGGLGTVVFKVYAQKIA